MQIVRACFSVILMVVFGCAQAPQTDTLMLRLGAEPSMLNPILSTDSPSSSVNGYVFNGLLTVEPSLELVPDLAESFTVSDSGLEFVFKLKRNVTWHDGVRFTAHDVKFTYDLILNPKTNTVRRSDYIIDGTPIEFRVIDEYTLQVRLPKPFAPILNRLSMGIIPKHIYEHVDVNVATANQRPIGTGSFKFKRWEAAQFVLLERNEDFFGVLPKLKHMLLKIIPDNNTALVSFEKEEILSSGVPAKDVERIAHRPQFDVHRYYDLAYTYLGFNCQNPLFKDKVLRQAIAQSIDKQAIVDGILLGYAKAAHIPTSPEMWTYPKTSFSYRYSPQHALQLLTQNGYEYDAQRNVLSKNGIPVSFKIITNKGNKDREKATVLIQSQLKKIGIDVSIQLMEWSSFIAIVNANQSPKEYDAIILGWSLGLDPDGYSLWHSSQYPQGFNIGGYKNKVVDGYLQQGRVELDRTKRAQVYQRLYDVIAKDVPYVFLYYPESLVGMNTRVQGLSPAGPAGLLNPIEAIYLQE
ncbi:peptide-binding protein [bacterium]|nr:peptide-binding protein [bacterium]